MLFIIIIFLLGLAIGSFINALEYRITEKKTMAGRSFCPHCKHQLAWYDLFPLLSFAFLGGKCRYCKKKISWQYPLIELVTGLTFSAVLFFSPFAVFLNLNQQIGNPTNVLRLLMPTNSYFSFMNWVSILITLIIFSILILVALHDAKTGYILSIYVFVAAFLALVLIFLGYQGGLDATMITSYFFPFIWSAIVPASILFSLYFFSKGKWMGAGDSELAVLMGLFLGFPLILVSFYTAFIVGSIWSLILVYVAKKAKMKSAVPLGPFLVLGVYVAYFLGPLLVDFYVKMFLGA